MGVENNKINPGDFDKKKLLEELAIDIARKYGIEKEKVENLIRQEAVSGIVSLKEELKKGITQKEKLDEIDLINFDELSKTLDGAKIIIENASQIEIKVLKDDVENKKSIENYRKRVEEYLPPELINKAKYPTVPHEHILGFALGTANSIAITTEILLNIGTGIIKTPYHIYMIVSGQGKTNSFKNT